MKLNKIDEFWNSANSLFKLIFSLLTSKNFVTMATWRNYFSPVNYKETGEEHLLGGVYMTLGRLSPRSEFNPVPSHGSIIVDMIPPQNFNPGVSSPLFLYRGENFTPVRNLATVSCKRETTTRFGVKSVCRQTKTGSACIMSPILNQTCILLTWSVPSNNGIWNDPASCKRDTKSKSHLGMKLAPVRVFSCKHPLTCLLSTYISTVTATLGSIVLKTKYRNFT